MRFYDGSLRPCYLCVLKSYLDLFSMFPFIDKTRLSIFVSFQSYLDGILLVTNR